MIVRADYIGLLAHGLPSNAHVRLNQMPLTQNFRFGTPTRTWYSLSSPECNDFTP